VRAARRAAKARSRVLAIAAPGGGEAQERGDPEGVGGGLGVDQRAAAVAALEDQAVRRRAPLRDEAVVVVAGVADIEIPG